MNIRYRVELSQAERDQLTALLSGGKHPVCKVKRAQILLAADAGVDDEAIAAGVSVGGVRLTEHEAVSRETVRRRLAEKELKTWQKDIHPLPRRRRLGWRRLRLR